MKVYVFATSIHGFQNEIRIFIPSKGVLMYDRGTKKIKYSPNVETLKEAKSATHHKIEEIGTIEVVEELINNTILTYQKIEESKKELYAVSQKLIKEIAPVLI